MADPNIYDLLMGSEPQASEQATAMAEMIRRGRQAQLLGALGSHRAISALGQAAGQQATQDQGLLERAGQARLRFGEEAMDRKASLAQTLEAMRQQGMMTRAMIGAQSAERRAAMKADQGKPLPSTERKTLEQLSSDLNNVRGLASSFKDQYASIVGGNQRIWLSKTLMPEGLVPAADKDRNYWWAQFQKLAQIPERHQFFGSAFTPTEKAAFDMAQSITPNADPNIIRRSFESMISILEGKLRTRSESLRGSGVYSTDEISPYSSALDDAAEKIRVRRKSDGAEGDIEPYLFNSMDYDRVK